MAANHSLSMLAHLLLDNAKANASERATSSLLCLPCAIIQ